MDPIQILRREHIDEQLETVSPSRNPRFGEKPLSFVIDHLLVEHAEIHRRQIERNMAQYREAFAER